MTWIAGLRQPRGPVFKPVVRANYQLARRKAKDLPINTNSIDGRVALGLGEKLGNHGTPADRTIREWAQENPDYPEKVIQAGIISESDILPEFLPYLHSVSFKNSLGQQKPLKSAGSSTKVRESGKLRQDGRAESGGIG